MKRLLNPEFKFYIQNLLCAEEHLIDMLRTSNEKDTKEIISKLRKLKLERNRVLNFPEKKDRNKWCLIKHLLLSEYHCIELLNQENIDISTIQESYKKINNILTNSINSSWDVNCTICEKELLINKIMKGVLNK